MTQQMQNWSKFRRPPSSERFNDNAFKTISIVFVHGLRGDQTATWTKGEVLWPRDLLSKDLAHARILAWGYNANIFSFWQATGKHELNGHSEQLVADLALERHDAVCTYCTARPLFLLQLEAERCKRRTDQSYSLHTA